MKHFALGILSEIFWLPLEVIAFGVDQSVCSLIGANVNRPPLSALIERLIEEAANLGAAKRSPIELPN